MKIFLLLLFFVPALSKAQDTTVYSHNSPSAASSVIIIRDTLTETQKTNVTTTTARFHTGT